MYYIYMEINRNELIAKYYALFDLEKQDKEDLTLTKFNKLIGVNFESFVKNKEREITENITLFENTKLSYFQERVKSILLTLEMKNIKSIIKDDFHLFECFNELKNSLFFFYEGQLEFLQKSYKDYVSVVGSRKTDKNMEWWVEKNVPKNKIIVSGLAKGADTIAHNNAIKNNQKIIIFPGVDITNKINLQQEKIINYARNEGTILYNLPPFQKTYYKNYFIERNKWMAQISFETYVLFFENKSGTLSQMYEVSKKPSNKVIKLPSNVYKKNLEFLKKNSWTEKIIQYLVEID